MPPAPLVTMGCVMMRVCNLDTCPMGIATQNPELRKRFKGKPEYVVNFMKFIAQELREYMARLGVRTVDELVGRTDLLRRKDDGAIPFARAREVDLSRILSNPYGDVKIAGYGEKQVFDFKLEETHGRERIFKEAALRLKQPAEKEPSGGCVQREPDPGDYFRVGDHEKIPGGPAGTTPLPSAAAEAADRASGPSSPEA